MTLFSCLVVTHPPRLKWRPWVEYQIAKQQLGAEHMETIIICDDRSIGEKRNEALSKATGRYIAWFDDDDWSYRDRLTEAFYALGDEDRPVHIFGNWRTQMVSARDLAVGGTPARAASFQSHEGVIFNGAVYRNERLPKFEHVSSREDTMWQQELHRTPRSMLLTPEPMHRWLVHTNNITNNEGAVDWNCVMPNFLDPTEQKILEKIYREG